MAESEVNMGSRLSSLQIHSEPLLLASSSLGSADGSALAGKGKQKKRGKGHWGSSSLLTSCKVRACTLSTQLSLSMRWSLCCHSVTQSCPTLCDPMDCSTPGLPVHHQLLEFTQTHVHRVGDAIQPSHPLLSPSAPTFNLSQHHGLFQ